MRCCAAFPRCTTKAGVGARFRWGEKSFAAPSAANLTVVLARPSDPVGWVRRSGMRLTPIPTSCGVAPEVTASLYHPQDG